MTEEFATQVALIVLSALVAGLTGLTAWGLRTIYTTNGQNFKALQTKVDGMATKLSEVENAQSNTAIHMDNLRKANRSLRKRVNSLFNSFIHIDRVVYAKLGIQIEPPLPEDEGEDDEL